MKGEQEEGKIIPGRPLFPRLSLTEIEKGGAKPPPRTTMALYGQHLFAPSKILSSVSSSSNQVLGKEKGAFLPFKRSLAPVQSTSRCCPSPTDRFSTNASESSTKKPSIIARNNSGNPNFARGIASLPCNFQHFRRPLRPKTEAESSLLTFVQSGTTSLCSSTNGPMIGTSSSQHLQSGYVAKRLKRSTSDLEQEYASIPKQATQDNGRKFKLVSQARNNISAGEPSAVLSPDHVIRLIGRKHFWKARAEIINQQRVFSRQVFELHRIIKVQKTLTSSTHSKQDNESVCQGKDITISSLKMELPPELIPKPPWSYVKPKDEFTGAKYFADDKQGENNILSPLNNNYNNATVATNFVSDTEKSTNMSQTKGLITNPYIGPSYFPPNGSTPINRYVMPTIPYGFLLCGPTMAVVPTYLTPHGMLIMGPTLSTSSLEHVLEKNEGKEMENAATSQKKEASPSGALPLFPAAPIGLESEHKTQVIKVIPRKPSLARESIARMFQSIQEQKKQL